MANLTGEEQMKLLLQESLDEALESPNVIKPSSLLMEEFYHGVVPFMTKLWQMGGLEQFRMFVSTSTMIVGVDFYYAGEFHSAVVEQNPLMEGTESLSLILDGVQLSDEVRL